MPKIRGVKPDYWTDEDIVDLTIPARLLFIGLWNHACDNGHLQDKPKQIKMRVLPGDEVNVAELLRELASKDRIIRANGWIIVPNFTKHQKPDKRYFQTCDKAGCERPPADSQRGTRGGHDESTTGTRGGHDVGSWGPHVDGDGDGDGEMKVINPSRPKGSRTPPVTPARFDEFWAAYDHKVGRKKAEAAYRSALKKPNVTDDLLIQAAAAYVASIKAEGKHPTFTKHPTTWLNGEHWRDERPARQQPLSRVQQHLQLARDLAAEQPAFPQIGDGR